MVSVRGILCPLEEGPVKLQADLGQGLRFEAEHNLQLMWALPVLPWDEVGLVWGHKQHLTIMGLENNQLVDDQDANIWNTFEALLI